MAKFRSICIQGGVGFADSNAFFTFFCFLILIIASSWLVSWSVIPFLAFWPCQCIPRRETGATFLDFAPFTSQGTIALAQQRRRSHPDWPEKWNQKIIEDPPQYIVTFSFTSWRWWKTFKMSKRQLNCGLEKLLSSFLNRVGLLFKRGGRGVGQLAFLLYCLMF